MILVTIAISPFNFILDKRCFTIQQQKVITKDYKEDIAIIHLAGQHSIVALIEVAFSVNPSLAKVLPSKLAECLLYAYYELKKGERESFTICSALTDFYTWHIFEVKIQRYVPKLKIEKYYTILHAVSEVNESDDSLKLLLADIIKFLVLCCK